MAFPGGRMDPSDQSLEDAVIRETVEELALDLTEGILLGQLDEIAPQSPLLPPVVIRPFVAVVSPEVAMMPNYEVAATYWVPLHQLLDPRTLTEHVTVENGIRVRHPGYRVGDNVVWGLTERIVRQLLSMVVP